MFLQFLNCIKHFLHKQCEGKKKNAAQNFTDLEDYITSKLPKIPLQSKSVDT
jgi:hypothetical protein